MVRLKHKIFVIRLNENKKSQFHYGSIKTSTVKKALDYIITSQFHYGSIKTTTKYYNVCWEGNGLNSTMVRLKLSAVSIPE